MRRDSAEGAPRSRFASADPRRLAVLRSPAPTLTSHPAWRNEALRAPRRIGRPSLAGRWVVGDPGGCRPSGPGRGSARCPRPAPRASRPAHMGGAVWEKARRPMGYPTRLPRRTLSVQGVVPAAVGLLSVLGAAATGSARDDTADRAELHSSRPLSAVPCPTLVTLDCRPVDIVTSVSRRRASVYSPTVLGPWKHPGAGTRRMTAGNALVGTAAFT